MDSTITLAENNIMKTYNKYKGVLNKAVKIFLVGRVLKNHRTVYLLKRGSLKKEIKSICKQ